MRCARPGARIDYLGKRGLSAARDRAARAAPARTVRVRGDVSSQFLSALLMALGADGRGVRVEVVGELISRPYVEMTLALMERFGVRVEREGWSAFAIPAARATVSPGAIDVEGDASSASYFLAAGAARRRAAARRGRGARAACRATCASPR